jgi:hypothetical protein
MSGLTEQAAGTPSVLDESRQRWEASMLAEIERIRADLRTADPEAIARRIGGTSRGLTVDLEYWGREAHIAWPELVPRKHDGQPFSAFDQAMLLYHLRRSDGAPPAGRWVSFRELPGGEFYHQAYTGYTGRRLAEAFGTQPDRFDAAADFGVRLAGPSSHSWGFAPLPRVALAACLWPGDEEMPAQASVLFDEHAGHHLPIDGLALLGAGLTGRLLKAAPSPG